MQLVSATAPVEIIAPGEGVDVYLRRSPLRQEREHARVPAGLSVAEILEYCGIEPSRLYVTINGHAIEAKNWSRVRVKPGAVLSIVKVPGKGALRSILSLVVAVAALFFAVPIAGALGLAGVAGATSVIAAGITIVGSLAINALFPPAKPEAPAIDKTKTLYSIGGGKNSANQYGAIPVVFGHHRISPPYAAGAYTELSGDDQYLRMLFVVGYGPVSISDLRIGETPIDRFADVSYEIIENHLTEAPTLYTKPVFEESVQILLENKIGWSLSSWTQRTTADDVDEISVDISFPNGVYRYQKKDGKRVNYQVVVEVEYAVAGSGAWVSLPAIGITASSSQAIRRSVIRAVARGQYDIRVRKASPDYNGGDTVSETTYWTALRGRRNASVVSFNK
ncbi:hypothetical protein HGP14_30520, partial [Rhizobium sp. P32RR-XVIII]|nr:hypothetical protein [Rhizobium sp. P32RR-XVIII]